MSSEHKCDEYTRILEFVSKYDINNSAELYTISDTHPGPGFSVFLRDECGIVYYNNRGLYNNSSEDVYKFYISK